MKPRPGIVGIGLALLTGWAAWAAWIGASQDAARYEIFAAPAAPRVAGQDPAAPLARPVRPAAYRSISGRNPFSARRGAAAPPTARPAAGQALAAPLPLLSGIANLGAGPTALLAARSGEKARWVAPGERAGSYRLESIQGDRLTFSLKGLQVSVSAKDLQDESRRRAARPQAAGRRQAARVPGPASAPGGERAGRGRYRIGVEFRPGRFSADAADGAPDGTVYQGYVRRIRHSPFGAQHWWERQE